jgi:NAD(P)-dependent dehydrogenase (short-subunit alcohol dehydrogenase family)
MAAAPKGTVICTGANGGLGTAFVKAFAASPEGSQYQAIYTVRDPATAHDLHAALKSAPKTHHSEILALNLASLQNIRAIASDINARVSQGHLPPIRALVLNAAFQDANVETLKPQAFTEDGFEMTFGVNYLANFLLVLLLLRSMDKEHGRIVLVSSWMHDPYSPHSSSHVIFKEEKYKVMFPGTADKLAKGIVYDDNGYYAGMRRYGASKTALVMFMYVRAGQKYPAPLLTSSGQTISISCHFYILHY